MRPVKALNHHFTIEGGGASWKCSGLDGVIGVVPPGKILVHILFKEDSLLTWVGLATPHRASDPCQLH
jgi:hypothetical protein